MHDALVGLLELPIQSVITATSEVLPTSVRPLEVIPFVSDAGMELARLNLNQSAELVWSEVLELACRSGRLHALMAVVVERCPGNSTLQSLRQMVGEPIR